MTGGWYEPMTEEKKKAIHDYMESWKNVRNASLVQGPILFEHAHHPLQSRWLGLGAEINIARQMGIPDLEFKLKRQRLALEFQMKVKQIGLPDEDEWRHPQLPYGFQETYERYMQEYPRENRAEMVADKRGQTGEGRKRKPRKGRAIRPKPVKIQKG